MQFLGIYIKVLALGLFVFITQTVSAQFDFSSARNPVISDSILSREEQGSLFPAISLPSLSNKKSVLPSTTSQSLGELKDKAFTMEEEQFLSTKTDDFVPKAFKEEEKVNTTLAKDQFLGEIKTSQKVVRVLYRDHEYVDGDLIRVYANQDVVQSRVFLDSFFKGITITLVPGYNQIEFEALNQGESGPNTAELHVYDEDGRIISAKEWNLLTGYRASIIVIKE